MTGMVESCYTNAREKIPVLEIRQCRLFVERDEGSFELWFEINYLNATSCYTKSLLKYVKILLVTTACVSSPSSL